MNAPENLRPETLAPGQAAADTTPLYLRAMAALADPDAAGAEAQWLRSQAHQAGGAGAAGFAEWQASPPAQDARLHALAGAWGLRPVESVAVAIACAVECDAMLGRVLAWLQAPTGGTRPTIGLMLTLAELLELGDASETLTALAEGGARTGGLLCVDEPTRPVPEQALRVPLPTMLALRSAAGNWPQVRIEGTPAGPVPPSLQQAANQQALALRSAANATGVQALVVRSGHPREAQGAAALLAHALGLVPAFIDGDLPFGLAPWLWLRGAIPVLCVELAPGETRRLSTLPGYRGPLLLASGLEGSFENDGDPLRSWHLPLPLPEERVALWRAHLGAEGAEHMGRAHRHAPAHIRFLARAAQHEARLAGDTTLTAAHVNTAARLGAAGELGTLAQRVTDSVDDDALVLPPELQAMLAALRQRCARRENLADALGPSARSRYRPGVRALFTGASGTGKTLAVAWLATRLGLPLYRVDLSAVASKYIGETEKNLAQLFARAEHAEVLLLFDEADALFGKRTEVKDANDRYANQQTNYLLQRMESFDGIAVLTSNSRSRFDAAFTRRLDAIIEFPLPGPQERRALWLAHLGTHHRLDTAQINRMAAACDLAGGHIRNATLAAASAEPGPVGFANLRAAIEAEYRKLGRQAPAGL